MRGIVLVGLFVFSIVPVFGQTKADRAINLEILNSSASEVAPIISADGETVYFTSDRPGGVGGQDFWMSRRVGGKWSTPVNISELNTPKNEGPDTITADGQTMYYTGCNRREDGSDKCDIYVSMLGKNGKWQPGKNLGTPINSDYEEANATVSADGNLMVFTSNRPGGQGGYDLWSSTRQSGGKWSEPKCLGPSINTSMWEGVAFLHADGVTMYFSSNGHGGFGNADIFQTQLKPDGSWEEPVNMGGLINSPSNDIYFTVPGSGDWAYFSSSAEGGSGREDIYSIPKEMILPSREFIVVKGRVTDAETGAPVAALLTATGRGGAPLKTTSNPNNGNYIFRLHIGESFIIGANAQGYLDSTSSIDLTKADPFAVIIHNIALIPLKEASMVSADCPSCPSCPVCPVIDEASMPPDAEEILIEGGTIVIRNVLFDFDKSVLRSEAVPIIERLVKFMGDNPTVKIRIAGFTDSVGSNDYNLKLSQKRSDAVKNYMVLRGVKANRIVTEAHGETKLVAQDDPKTGNIENRRVEFSLVRGTYKPPAATNVSMRGKMPVVEDASPAEPVKREEPAVETKIEKSADIDADVITIPTQPKIYKALVARDIVNRAPQGAGSSFSSDIGKLYFFTHIIGAQEETTITHLWYYRGHVVSRIPLKIASGDFRTWSYITIPNTWSGQLKCEALGPDGKVLGTVTFTIKK